MFIFFTFVYILMLYLTIEWLLYISTR